MDLRRKRIIAAATAISDNFLMNILENESESSSDGDDSEDELAVQLQLHERRDKPARIVGYVEETIPSLTHEQFRLHFRLTPATYEHLEARLTPVLQGAAGVKPHIPVRKQLLATLWLLATPDSYRSVGERFDIGKSSLSVSFMRVVEVLNDLAEDVIKWPRGDRLAAVKQSFQHITTLPDVIGAVDGTHIPIKEPIVDSQFYKTYKKRYAIILQAVCDAELVFMDCFAGYPGSVGDVRVFRNSDLWSEVHSDIQSYFPSEEYIIGDKAYPVLRWCIPPYRDRGNLNESLNLLLHSYNVHSTQFMPKLDKSLNEHLLC